MQSVGLGMSTECAAAACAAAACVPSVRREMFVAKEFYNSLAQHWARDWRALALTQVHRERILQPNSLAHARFTQQAKRGRRLLVEAVVLTEAAVGFAVRRRMVESASTVVLAERTIPIIFRLHPAPPPVAPAAPPAKELTGNSL